MNSKVNKTKTTRKYPKLMINTGDCEGLVILMQYEGKGIVLHNPTPFYAIGHWSSTWAMDEFENFEGEVTICN
ncbi:hypothetical protein COB55_04100 [Candidatus Wolfebacteria bacterium]|nr:MAG: hypothetical protein COB55_04100 [Candidatus Wolfebacteria bacterium]